MAGRLTNQIRIEQTHDGLERLQAEIDDWLCRRRKKDKLQQYHTQLNSLEEVLLGLLAKFRTQFDGVADTQPSGEVYAACRACDKSVLRLSRIWLYFKTRFDQRDDPQFAEVLAAADEVAWSCYKEVFNNITQPVSRQVIRGTIPLPYIEANYSPRAIPRDDPPGDLYDAELRKHIQDLPIPIVSLPPICLQEPWWLIYLGHEIGHHVQHDLAPNKELVNNFGSLLKTTALNAPEPVCDARGAERWYNWRQEIFADLCSIYSMGPWAVRALVELERSDEKTMLTSKTAYPSSVVRLELLAHIVDALGLDGHAALDGIMPTDMVTGAPLRDGNVDLRQVASNDLKMIPKIVATTTTAPLADLEGFKKLYDWNSTDFRPGGRVDTWTRELLTKPQPYPQEVLSAPRMIICAAVAAWLQVATITDVTRRKEARQRLAERLLPLLKSSREAGVRAPESIAQPDTTGLVDQLAQELLQQGSTDAAGY